jgi:hypothetical protein
VAGFGTIAGAIMCQRVFFVKGMIGRDYILKRGRCRNNSAESDEQVSSIHNSSLISLVSGGLDLFNCHDTSAGDFFILLCALRAADADGANDVFTVLDWHSALQGSEIRRESGHGETAFVDEGFEIGGGLFEEDRGFRFADGDLRTSQKSAVETNEINQVTAVIDHSYGASGGSIGFCIGHRGLGCFARSFEGQSVFRRNVLSPERSGSEQKEAAQEFNNGLFHIGYI